MDKLIANFSGQLKESLDIGSKASFTEHDRQFQNIVVSGLGGSGIGGDLVSEIVRRDLKIPYIVNKDYFLPAFVDENSLVIISSYSGNTEETVHAMEAALLTGCKIVCVSTNGKVLEVAQKKELDHVILPGGMSPRACLGYSFIQQLYILKAFSLISDDFEEDIKASIKLLDEEEESIKTKAKNLASDLKDKIPIIYASSSKESVAVRWRQQLNENSKILCWHHVIPEMNHNELVGWRTERDDLAVIFLRNIDDYSRNQQRIEINKMIFKKYTPNIHEVYSKGSTFIQKAMYLVHFGDWVSLYLCQLRNMDPIEVDVIDFLKGELANL